MKRIITCLFVLVIALSCNIRRKPSTDEARAFNDRVMKMIDQYQDTDNEFKSRLFDDSRDHETSLDELQETIHTITRSIKALPSFDDEDELKNAAVDYMETIETMTDTAYPQIVLILNEWDYKNPGTYKFQDILTGYQDLYDKIQKAQVRALEAFDMKQREFACKYRFKIEYN